MPQTHAADCSGAAMFRISRSETLERQFSIQPQSLDFQEIMVGATGIEPVTPPV
jgi:hypothetical protein